MTKPIRHVVVVGGGSAGWMSAAFLQKVLGQGRSPVRFTLVESPDVDIIGVGEATIPSIRQFLQVVDVPEWRLLAEADATFKGAVRFSGWSSVDGGGDFYHPFDPASIGEGFNAGIHWLGLKEAGLAVPPLDRATSIIARLCDEGRSPKLFQSQPYEAPVPYAYHFDAVKFGRMLRDVATSRGVERIEDHVEGVTLTEDGDIAALRTRSGRVIEGDFFVDCTGFAALLVEKHLGEGFVSYADRLLCDRAVAAQVPHAAPSPALRPYTTATAMSAGWMWDIDLVSRRGTGYVYSSQYIDDDDARSELLARLGTGPDQPTRRLDMRVGRRQNVWVRNCLAVGLSAGFVEPLESTGIYLIEIALSLLVDYIALGDGAVMARERYNALYRNVYDEIVNFILLHYIFNGRRGQPFWDAYREKVLLPPVLVESLQLWAYKVPSRTDLNSRVPLFDASSYFLIMAGMNTLPPFGANLSPYLDLERSASVLRGIAETQEQACRASPMHADILQKLRAAAG